MLGSISFSILAGRVSFKDLRYHSANQTIVVVKGQISWRYWIRAPAEEDDLIHARVIGEGIQRESFALNASHALILHSCYFIYLHC